MGHNGHSKLEASIHIIRVERGFMPTNIIMLFFQHYSCHLESFGVNLSQSESTAVVEFHLESVFDNFGLMHGL